MVSTGPFVPLLRVSICAAPCLPTWHIFKSRDARYLARHQKPGDPPVVPLYTQADADAAQKLFQPVPYHQDTQIADGFHYHLHDAGHRLGSSSMVLEAEGVKLAFTGDLGRPGLPIIRDPDTLPPIDYLIMESTYGDRLHDEDETVIAKLEETVNRTIKRGGGSSFLRLQSGAYSS